MSFRRNLSICAAVLACAASAHAGTVLKDSWAAWTPNAFGSVDYPAWQSNMIQAARTGVTPQGAGAGTFADVNFTVGNDHRNIIVTDTTAPVGQVGDLGSRLSFVAVFADDAGGKVSLGSGGIRPIIGRTLDWSAVADQTSASYTRVLALNADASSPSGYAIVAEGTSDSLTATADLVIAWNSYGFEPAPGAPVATPGSFDFLLKNLRDPGFEQSDPNWSAGALYGIHGNVYADLAGFRAGTSLGDGYSVEFAAVPTPAAAAGGLLLLGNMLLSRRRSACA